MSSLVDWYPTIRLHPRTPTRTRTENASQQAAFETGAYTISPWGHSEQQKDHVPQIGLEPTT